MTKLNHNRPSLRYIDNLRRELRRENRPAPHWFNPDRIDKFGVQLSKPESLSAYILDFGKLELRQQEIAGCAIETFGEYLEASTAVISLIMGGKSKARKAAREAQETALEAFVVSGAVLVGTIINDMKEQRHGFWEWFQDFYAGLDRQSKFTWSDFADLLLKESLPLYFAQQLSDSPEQTARLRDLFSEENW